MYINHNLPSSLVLKFFLGLNLFFFQVIHDVICGLYKKNVLNETNK